MSMLHSRADIQIINPVFLEILLKYKSLNAFDSETFNVFGVTMREAKEYTCGGFYGFDEEDEEDDTVYVVALPDFTDEPHFDFGPEKIEDTIDCVLRLIEDECRIINSDVFQQFKNEIKANAERINESYEWIYWDSTCDEPDDSWSFFFEFPEDEEEFFDEDELFAEDDEKETNNDFDDLDDIVYPSNDQEWDEWRHGIGAALEWKKGIDFFCDIDDPIIPVKEIVVSADTSKIPPYAYCRYGMLNRVILEDGITEIGEYAFAGCETLQSIRIPGSVKKIGKGAFSSCKVRKVSKYDSGIYYEYCNNLKEVIFEEGLEEIEDEAFSNCRSLTKLVFPRSLKKIGAKAFWECINLVEIEFRGSIDYIGSSAFAANDFYTYHNTRPTLESVHISGDCGAIGSYAFRCSSIKTMTIDGTVGRIGHGAFQGDKMLEQFYCESVGELDSDIWEDCYALTDVRLGDGIKSMPYDCFKNCRGLGQIRLPITLERIEREAFAGCTSLKSIEFPKELKEIGDDAFSNCKQLGEITLKGNLTRIGKKAFKDCPIQVLHNCSQDLLMQKAYEENQNSFTGKVVVPGDIKKLTKTFFRPFPNPQSVVISDGVTEIGREAFREFRFLSSVEIPGSVKKIGTLAFDECENLSNVVIKEGVEEIEGGAFRGTAVTEIFIPGSVKQIRRIFPDSIKKIVLGEGVQVLGQSSLNVGKENDLEIVIPNTITKFDACGLTENTTIYINGITDTWLEYAQKKFLRVIDTSKAEPIIKDYRAFSGDIGKLAGVFEDPGRLERAKKLRLQRIDDTHFYITGGKEPHYVTKESDGQLVCDCLDFADGTRNCKHVIRVRLELEE